MKEIGPRDMEGGGVPSVPDLGTANVQSFITGIVVFLPPATKLRQSNVFTLVCHSVHRGISVRGVSVQGGYVRGVSVRETPGPAVRLRAGSTHPTGMHSCSIFHFTGTLLDH